MNILVSYNWLKEYLKTDLKPEDFASRVSLSGVGVERIYPQGELLDKMVIGKILKLKKHPNADKLKLAKTDIGGKKLDFVCGGTNLREGMKVAVALSGAKVRWHGEGELVELKSTEIRGIKSEGMICASEEIGLEWQFSAKDDREILDLSNLDVKVGEPLAKALKLEDTIFDVEVTTNRPDALSILGVAREAGTILKKPFQMPKIKAIKGKKSRMLRVENKEPDLCERYQAVLIEGVKVGESPWWLKRKLMAAGTRSINNIVDITNLVLWEMGQPLHAFDYDKVSNSKIVVRKAKAGEKIKALDGLDYKLESHHLVIADGKNACAIAGIMGGEKSGVTEKTDKIVLESATFNPVSVRKTSREIGLRSESSNLFEKGLSTEATEYALARATQLILEIAGGKIASQVFDERSKYFRPKEVSLSVERANKIIGVELKAEEMKDILKRLGFDVKSEGKTIKAKAPYWREGDIEIEEDLIEEIARIYGYHKLPSVLPASAIPDEAPDKQFEWEKKIKDFCVSAGFSEAMPYSFVSKKMIDDYSKKGEIKLANPLSEDLEYMRPSLLPGLLRIAQENENNFAEGKVFELNRIYLPSKGLPAGRQGLPKEEMRFSGVIWGKSPNGELFYKAKGFVEEFLNRFGVDYTLKKHKNINYHPARAMKVIIGKEHIACLGEIHPITANKFGLESQVGFFNFVFEKLSTELKCHKTYTPLPAYPGVKRDIAFVVDAKKQYAEIEEAIYALNELISEVESFDIYRDAKIGKNKKSIALHILFRSSHKTLETKEVEDIWKNLVKILREKFKAEIRM